MAVRLGGGGSGLSSGLRPKWVLFSITQLASVYLVTSAGMTKRPCPRQTAPSCPPAESKTCPPCPVCSQPKPQAASAGTSQGAQLRAEVSRAATSPPVEGSWDATSADKVRALFERERPHFDGYNAAASRGGEHRRRHGPLKIAGFTRLWPPPVHAKGGMQYHAQHLYSRLVALGHTVHVFTTNRPGAVRKRYFTVDPTSLHLAEASPGTANLVIHQTPSQQDGRYSVMWYDTTLAHFKEVSAAIGGFDVAHSESWAGVANAHQLQLPMVVTWHGSMFDWFRNEMNLIVHNSRLKHKAPGKEIVDRMKGLGASVAYETFALQSVAHHIVISDSAAADLKAADLIQSERVHLVYNGVNEANFQPDPSARIPFLTRHNIDPAMYVIGCGGRLAAEKGHQQLAKAAEVLLRKHDDIALVVAGSGSEGNRYDKLRKAGLRVHLVGMLGQKELAAFYNAIDAFVDPYWQHHGLNTVMIEAALSGTPIIATALASSATTVPNGGFGRTFALGVQDDLVSAVEHLKEHKELRAQIGRNLRERALKLFTSTVMANAYENVLYEAKLSHLPQQPVTGEVVCKDTYPAMCFRMPE